MNEKLFFLEFFFYFHYLLQTEPHNPATKDQQPQLFPENIHGIQDTKITDIELTSDFFIFSTDVSIFSCFLFFTEIHF